MSKSPTLSLQDQTVMPSPKCWNAILKLAQQGQDCEKEIDNLQKSMKATRRQLGELGISKKTTELPEWKALSDAYTLGDLTLDSLRARLKDLSTQQNALVCGSAQDKFLDDAAVDKILNSKNDPSGTLYAHAMKTAQAAGVKPEIGESDADAAKRKKPSPLDVQINKQSPTSPHAGWRNWMPGDLHDILDIKDRQALIAGGVETMGVLYEASGKGGTVLSSVPNLSKKGISTIEAWITARLNEEKGNDAKTAAAQGVSPGTSNGKHPAADKPSKGKGGRKGGGK